MKKSQILIWAAITAITISHTARADKCTQQSCPSSTNDWTGVDSNCTATGATYCYKAMSGTNFKVINCSKCKAGYTLVSVDATSSCVPQLSYNKCQCICSNCTSDTAYSSVGTGYERRIYRYCDCSSGTATCKSNTSYRCAIGYWGSSSNGTSGCTRCPSSGGVYGSTKNAGSTSQTSCFVPAGTGFSDTTGSGTFTAECFYTK